MKNILSGCLHKNIDSIGGAWIGIIVWGFLCVCTNSYGQALRGTTGLLHAPTADMQQDKTFMFGGNVLDIIPLHYYDFDVKYTFKEPAICKSRPLENNTNNILLKLEKIGTFAF